MNRHLLALTFITLTVAAAAGVSLGDDDVASVRDAVKDDMQSILKDMENATTAEEMAEIQARLRKLSERMAPEVTKVQQAEAAPAEPDAEAQGAADDGELSMFGGGGGDVLMLYEHIPVVITSSRVEEPIDLAPNVMYVLTRDEIRKYGYRRPIDILSRIPGFYHLFSSNINQRLLTVRGIVLGENVQVALRVNGHRINNVNEDSSMIWPVSLDIVDRVEVIVGPGSILYGSDTLLATINLITRDMQGMEAVGTYGVGHMHSKERGTYRGEDAKLDQYGAATLMGGHKWADDKKAFGSVTYAQRRQGWFTPLNGDADILGWPIDTLQPSYFMFGSVQFGEWYFQATSLNQEIGRLKYTGGGHNTGRGNYVDTFVLRNKHEVNENLSTIMELSYDRKRYVRNGGWWFDHTLHIYSGELGIQHKTDRNFLQAGVQFTYNDNKENYFISGYPGNIAQNRNAQRFLLPENTNVISAYVSDKYTVTDKITLVGALRLDRSSITDPNHAYVSPRLAIITQPMDKWVFKIMYNTAIKYPEPAHSELSIFKNRELGYTSGPLWGMAKTPESLAALEFQSIHYIGKGRLSGSFYWQKLNDLTGWYSGPGGTSGWTTVGDFKGIGAEIDFRMPVNEWFEFWVNGAWESTKFDAMGPAAETGIDYETPDGAMNQVPEYTANAGAELKLTKDISLTGQMQFVTELPVHRRRGPNGNTKYWDIIRNECFVDVTLLWQNFLIDDLDVSITGRNILNNRPFLPRQREVGDMWAEGARVELTVFYKW